ncbi:trypsin-like peptidase domain-containing protein [Streptomyces sp. TRM66268-LWL]|uniref:non-specific serine/threonine protein kinase n=1 Tax=Streptomyces polyasparticus TaxID=2767826 RepID=A0ABR7SN61_9ACTN|nr:tetratricopeptide repeat protein [Streptomyces polyasparticus]MBC9716417.1 trypsin-like peptidase domain-containing protein [Streptomyces polyasparticus]
MGTSRRSLNSTPGQESWRVRLFRAAERTEPLGAGVLVHPRYVVSCAQVVLPDGSPAVRPYEDLYADFPGAPGPDPAEPVRARVVDGRLIPPRPGRGGDLVLLELEEEPAAGVRPARLHRQIPARGAPVQVTGYPCDLLGGELTETVLLGLGDPESLAGAGKPADAHRPASGWVALDTADVSIREGYSGAGVVHARSGRVIGLLTRRLGRRGTAHPADRLDHASLIPTETVQRELGLEELGITVTGVRAVAGDIARPVRASAGEQPDPGLRRRLVRWLDGEMDALPVEVVFVREGRTGDLDTLRGTLLAADREQQSRPPEETAGEGPLTGAIDFAVDATTRTVSHLIHRFAERAGIDTGPASPDERVHDERLLSRIAADCPGMTAAFLFPDDCSSAPEDVLALLLAVRARRQARLLLAFRDPRAPLLRLLYEQMLGREWPAAVGERIEQRLHELRRVRQRVSERTHETRPDDAEELLGRLDRHRRAALSDPLRAVYDLYLLELDVENRLLALRAREARLAAPLEISIEPPGEGLEELPRVQVRGPRLTGPAPRSTPRPRSEPPGREPRFVEPEEQYHVVGRLASGSYGQVYLAHDRALLNRLVALKRHNPRDDYAAEQAAAERVRLVDLNHPFIVKVHNAILDKDGGGPLLVMEFADGLALENIRQRMLRREPPFHDERVFEFIAVYGVRILDALQYLHTVKELVYGDLSLNNVLHCGDTIKLIDVAAVRDFGEAGPCTVNPPEARGEGRMGPPGDLYCLGDVLRNLLEAAPAVQGLGARSLRLTIARAMRRDPAERFASAEEMAGQLHAVLRELRSLRLNEETFAPSLHFGPVADTLDGGLGSAPPLEQWADGGSHKRLLGPQPPPAPADAAADLPPPHPDRNDPNWKRLQRIAYNDPKGLLGRIARWDPTPELLLLHCRLHIHQARAARNTLALPHESEDPRERPRSPLDELVHQLEAAQEALREAGRLIGAPRAAHDWRIPWHEGLLHLAHQRVERARPLFTQVYEDIPGEYAPKLALGYCHEHLGQAGQAKEFYRSVWCRNHAQGSAAFGLARMHLADRLPREAVVALEGVPPDSRHRTAARTALVRIHAGLHDRQPAPTLGEFTLAFSALRRLVEYEGLTDTAAEERLRTDLLELLVLVVDTARRTGTDPWSELAGRLPVDLDRDLPAALRVPRTQEQLLLRLSDSYRRLARQVPRTGRAADDALIEALLDNAHRVRPTRVRHRAEGAGPRLPRWLSGGREADG